MNKYFCYIDKYSHIHVEQIYSEINISDFKTDETPFLIPPFEALNYIEAEKKVEELFMNMFRTNIIKSLVDETIEIINDKKNPD